MAIKGKRVIFAGPETVSHLNVDGYPSLATEAGILPGMLLGTVATGFVKHATDGATDAPLVLVADMDVTDPAATVDTAYTSADTMFAFQLIPGMTANMLIAASQNLTKIGVPLTSNGDGYLRIGVAGTDVIVAYSDEIVNVTSAALARVRGA